MDISRLRKPGRGLPKRYMLVMWVLVLSAVAFMDRTNISIAGVQLSREFKIDNAHLGWIFSAFLIGYASFQIPGGVLARRLGPRRVIALGVIWSGVFTALTAAVPSGIRGALLVLIVVRFSLAAGEAITYPAANQFVERWFPIDERGRANGIIFGGVGLGSGLTPPLVTVIMLHYGWRASFWFSAVVVLLAGTIWYLVARDTPEEHAWVRAGEL
jgi:ACS family glucarate transporter-like MFS transporter